MLRFTTAEPITAGDDVAFYSFPSRFLSFTTVVLENTIHIFQGPSTSLWYKQVCPDKGQEAEYGKERISPEFGVLDKWRSDQPLGEHRENSTWVSKKGVHTHNDEIIKPIGTCC